MNDDLTPVTEPSSAVTTDDPFPDGTTDADADHTCWVCGGETVYRHCKIICANCGFMRDCSDP